jgi:CRP-like cAMP-binding protein
MEPLMSEATHPLAPFVAKLESHSRLSEGDRVAILALPHVVRSFAPHSYFLVEGSTGETCCFLVSGYAYRHKCTSAGSRQILSVHMRGDGIDLQNAVLPRADHNIQALTAVSAAFAPVEAVRALFASHPGAGLAIWRDTLVDASIHREWTLNVGRRDARTRIAHLLCEIAFREQRAGIGRGDEYELPLTQEQLADCTGLTAVHVNRVVQQLRSDRLIDQQKRELVIGDWDRLAKVADFEPAYLFAEPVVPA